MKRFTRFIALSFLYTVGFILLMAVTLLIFRVNPIRALPLLMHGAIGGGSTNPVYALSETLVEMTPLLLTSLGVVVAWKAGMFSIGGEGQLLMGALAAMSLSKLNHYINSNLLILIMILGGIGAGALWGAIAGWLRVKRNVQEVISTIMLNYIALYLVGAMVNGPLQEASRSGPQSDLLPDKLLLAHLIPPYLSGGIASRLHSGFLLAILAVPIVWCFLYRTAEGFALRVTGQNMDAARSARMDVNRARVLAMTFSGALCGLAGAIQLLGVSERLDANFSPGWGYTAIPVALMGGLHPIGALFSALFFGALTAGSANLERSSLQVPAVVINVVQAAAVLAILGVRAWKTRQSAEAAE